MSSFVLSLIFALRFQTPESHSPTTQKTCTPGVSFWKLLDEVRIGYTDGRLGLGRLYAVCLPPPDKQSSSNYPYDPDGGGKLSTVVKTADGKVLNTYVWYAESIGGLWELSRYPYGEYPFVVKGGRIELQGSQVREKTDPMVYITDYLSGGRYTSWWIKRI